MKNILILSLLLIVQSCNNTNDGSHSYSKSDLQKLRWIEGNWKGMDGSSPFYEIYTMTNDSTIEIITYQWNGTDSSGSSLSVLKWKDGHYYLGENLYWIVTEITDSSVFMDINYNAYNTTLWRKRDENAWDAVLEIQNGSKKEYLMERISHFK